MSLSGDEPNDGDEIFDQLKSIRPYTVGQLFSNFLDIQYEPTPIGALQNATASNVEHDKILFENLVDYEQLRIKLNHLEQDIRETHKKNLLNLNKSWNFKSETIRKIGMCQQGKIANLIIKYKQASLDSKQIDLVDGHFTRMIDTLSKDYMYYSFESQMKLYKIKAELAQVYQNDDPQDTTRLKSLICTLIDFIRHLGDSRSEFLKQCRKWLRSLVRKFLKSEKTEDYKFIISQLCKGPAKTSLWSADLIECQSYSQTSQFESCPEYIGHCCTILSELFNHLRLKLKKIKMNDSNSVSDNIGSSCSSNVGQDCEVNIVQSWALIDTRYTKFEDVDVDASSSIFSELDVINYCLRIPVVQIFRHHVNKSLETLHINEQKTNCENLMLEFIILATIIIKTYQTGLETFDKIQYSNLIDYLSHEIRSTVIILSDQWAELKRRLKKSPQNNLLMRLQVEYDNFVLRSISIILELRQNGIWRHLTSRSGDQPSTENTDEATDQSNTWSTTSLRSAIAKVTDYISSTPKPDSSIGQQSNQSNMVRNSPLTHEFSVEWFNEVSEPMLWHILWQFYNNASKSACDYHSDNYWLSKFREKSVVYLLIDKMRYSTKSDRNFMLNSMTNMLMSRGRQNSNLITFIATEILELSFKKEPTRLKIVEEGTKCLIRSAEQYPRLISLYIDYLDKNDLDHHVVTFIKGCSLNGWLCSEDQFQVLSKWLINETPLSSTRNKVTRIIFSKLLINSPDTRQTGSNSICLDDTQSVTSEFILQRTRRYVDIHLRRKLALLLYEASLKHADESIDLNSRSLGDLVELTLTQRFYDRSSKLAKSLLDLSTDESYAKFYTWIWHLLLSFKLHILDQQDTDWNNVKSPSETSRSIKNTVLLNDSFHPSPSIHDSECEILSNGVSRHNPMALFIDLLMTDLTWQEDKIETCLDHMNLMSTSGYITPSLMASTLR